VVFERPIAALGQASSLHLRKPLKRNEIDVYISPTKICLSVVQFV
jgi:hypothetical protein